MKPGKGWTDIRPGIELVPSEVKLRERRLREVLELEARADAFENFPMQNIQLDERPPPAAHFVHARVIFPCARHLRTRASRDHDPLA